jgi:hypothetical protein
VAFVRLWQLKKEEIEDVLLTQVKNDGRQSKKVYSAFGFF